MEDTAEYRSPGQFLAALLKERGWNQRVLAIVLGVDISLINHLVSDKRPIKAEMAVALEDLFGVPAEKFLEFQKSYDLAMARLLARPDPARATRAQLFGGLPVAEMMKRGWLPDANRISDVPSVESALAKFFGVSSPSEIEILPHAAKKTNVTAETTTTQLAWLHRVKQIASEMLVAPYSAKSGRSAIPKLSALLSAPEEARKVPRIMTECGIRFVIVESLSSAKIDGVCFWLSDSAPVIGMSLRHDRMDNFWFVLRHELEHVLCMHGRPAITVDAELEGWRAGVDANVSEDERVANAAASEFCVPKEAMEGFVARKAPFFAERDIIGFSRTLNVHPGLVAGQLQHLTNRFDRFRNHHVKIRHAVLPSAVVDGWGDVAPVGI